MLVGIYAWLLGNAIKKRITLGKMGIESDIDIDIELRVCDARVNSVSIQARPALDLTRIFAGKTISQLLHDLPPLFGGGANVQAIAAVQACEDAGRITPSDNQIVLRELLLTTASVHQQLLHILLNWSAKLGLDPPQPLIEELTETTTQIRTAVGMGDACFTPAGNAIAVRQTQLYAAVEKLMSLCREAVFKQPVSDWNTLHSLEGLLDWQLTKSSLATQLLDFIQARDWVQLGRVAFPFLPTLSAESLRTTCMESDGQVVLQPEWQGQVYETSSLSRQALTPLVQSCRAVFGNGLLTRVVAHLKDLSLAMENLWMLSQLIREQTDVTAVDTASLTGVGLAQVAAVEGNLIHCLKLDAGLIERYQVITPTQWNFHPAGIVKMALTKLQGQDLEVQAKILVETIDPCVRFEIHPKASDNIHA